MKIYDRKIILIFCQAQALVLRLGVDFVLTLSKQQEPPNQMKVDFCTEDPIFVEGFFQFFNTHWQGEMNLNS